MIPKKRGERIVVIEGTSGNPQEDRDFKYALKLCQLEAGYKSIKDMTLDLYLKAFPELEPFIEAQRMERRGRPRKEGK